MKYYINKLYHIKNITTFQVDGDYTKIKHQLNNISTDIII